MVQFRTAYDGNRYSVSLKFLDENGDPAVGRTKQCFKDTCDVNKILRQYDKTGLLTHVNEAQKRYGDFTQVNEYQVSLNIVNEAKASFAALPSNVRKEFDNDPGKFMEFISNPQNLDKMVEMGLAVKPSKQAPTEVVIINPEGDTPPSK